MNPTSASSRILTALGSLGLLVILLIGVPMMLWTIAGSPVPSDAPSMTNVVDRLAEGPITDSTIIQIVALLGWIAWLQVALSIVVETVAWARGLTAPRLVLVGPMQPAVVKLVASAALVLSSGSIKTAPLGATPSPSPQVALVQATFAEATEVPSTAVPLANGSEQVRAKPAEQKVHTVERRDTLWGLAETHLGDPFRWHELFELNRGKPQPDGRALEDPNLIVVGWQLAFPDDAVGLEPAVVEATEPVSHVRPAEDHGTTTDLPPSSVPVVEAPPAAVPSRRASEPSAPRVSVRQAEHEQQAPQEAGPTDQDDSTNDGDDATSRRLAPLMGGSLLAAALVTLIDRLRRVRIRQHRIPSSESNDEQLQDTEIRLRHAADLDGAARVDLALRALATGLNRRGSEDIAILAVRLDGKGIEVLLDQPAAAPPAGFTSTGDARGWCLDSDLTDEELRVLANGATAPLPALVTIGIADGDPVLIDIETAGLLTIGGPTDLTDPYLHRIATELATSTWTDHLDLLTVGEELGDPAGTHRARHFDTLDDAVQHLRSIASATSEELAAADRSTTVQARTASDHGDGWIPTILICRDEVSANELDELAGALPPGRGIGMVVAAPDPDWGWHAHLTEDAIHLDPHELVLQPVSLDAETAVAIDEVLAEVAIEPAAEPEQSPDAGGRCERTEPVQTLHSDCFQEREFDLEFRVLGNIDVVGAPPIDRRKSMEIAVYLALHPEGVTDDRLKTVFWPDGAPAQSTFNTTVSMTRSALGTNGKGELYLPHYASTRQRYRLAKSLTTDLARFEARAAFAKNAPADQAREALADALEMVRGQPFDIGRGYEWAFAEGYVTRAALVVAEAAHHLARLALEEDDESQAEWAATRGLLASPGDEALYRDRMLAAHAAGNTAAIKQIMHELCEVIEANEPYDHLHPDTLLLFKSLSGKEAPLET